MAAFNDWLFWQRCRPDMVGDVARDAMPDGRCSKCPESSSLTAWRAHLADLGYSGVELAEFTRVWAEWKGGG